MKLVAYYQTNGQPALGASVVISGWTTAGALVVSGASMTEIAGGFYAYDHTDYSYLEDYVYLCKAAALGNGEQYVPITNDSDSQNNQGIVKQILGLVMGCSRVKSQMYDGSGNLLTAQLVTYDNATDCTLDQNPIHTYAITASYTDGKLTGYKSVEV